MRLYHLYVTPGRKRETTLYHAWYATNAHVLMQRINRLARAGFKVFLRERELHKSVREFR